jgi:hypothetical protein
LTWSRSRSYTGFWTLELRAFAIIASSLATNTGVIPGQLGGDEEGTFGDFAHTLSSD